MKKFLAMILALVMALSLVACGDKKDDTKTDDNQGDNTEVTEITNADEIADEMTSEDGKYEIAFVTDVGQLKDKSFNQGAWEGMKKYAEENGSKKIFGRTVLTKAGAASEKQHQKFLEQPERAEGRAIDTAEKEREKQ